MSRRQVMVRYRVHPERAEENAALVRAVYDQLTEQAPPGFRYATYQLDDGVTFVHLAFSDGPVPLPELPAFQRFQAGIAERCVEPPHASELHEVGSYDGYGQ
jgi:hypothetical protein